MLMERVSWRQWPCSLPWRLGLGTIPQLFPQLNGTKKVFPARQRSSAGDEVTELIIQVIFARRQPPPSIPPGISHALR